MHAVLRGHTLSISIVHVRRGAPHSCGRAFGCDVVSHCTSAQPANSGQSGFCTSIFEYQGKQSLPRVNRRAANDGGRQKRQSSTR